MNRLTFLLLILLTILLAACQTAAPAIDTPVPTETSAATDSEPAATPTPVPPSSPTAEAPPATTPVSTESSGKPNIQATVAAMAKSVTVVPPTLVAGATTNIIAPDDYLGMFEEGWRIVRDNYVRDNYNGVDWDAIHEKYLPRAQAIQDSESFWAMMKDMVAELGDDHSRFVSPDDFGREFNIELSNPSSSGLRWTGMTIWPAREDEQLMIWDVCKIGPAADAGLQRGDVILAIDGQEVVRTEDGFDEDLIRKALVGNGTVTLTVLQGPGEEPRDVTLRYGGGADCGGGWVYGLLSESPRVGYLRIPDFGGDAETNTLDLIEQMEEEAPLDGLIVDVRHNPGGNADSTIAIFTTGVFGKVGPLRKDATQTIYRIRGPVRWNETTPMVLLTDGASHSAAEYFATAMQQSGRAVLVGQPTAGNTEGISGFSLPDGSLIRLAVMTLVLPDGSTLEGVGVIPDVLAPLGEFGLREDYDAQLQTAYDTLLDLIDAQR